MNENYNNFQRKFKTEDLMIFETKFWRWSLRPVQVTLGAGILSLKRPAEHMSDITEDESKDLVRIIRVIENTLSDVFRYKQINYLMLMMVDFHVHYHVIPRYDTAINCVGEEWIDVSYPTLPAIGGTPTDDRILTQILKFLQDKVVSN